jgi:hypothetical protein
MQPSALQPQMLDPLQQQQYQAASVAPRNSKMTATSDFKRGKAVALKLLLKMHSY